MTRTTRAPWVWPVAILLLLFIGAPLLLYAYRSQSPAVQSVPVTQAVQEIQNGSVREIIIEENEAMLTLNDGARQRTVMAFGDVSIPQAVAQRNQADPAHAVQMRTQPAPPNLAVLGFFIALFPTLLLIALVIVAAYVLARGRKGDPYERLTRIADLRDRGVLTEEEFQREKRKLLS